jgi:hypothetical protein
MYLSIMTVTIANIEIILHKLFCMLDHLSTCQCKITYLNNAQQGIHPFRLQTKQLASNWEVQHASLLL